MDLLGHLETRREGPTARWAALSLPFEDCACQLQQCQAGSIRLSLEVSFVGPTVFLWHLRGHQLKKKVDRVFCQENILKVSMGCRVDTVGTL